MKTRIQGCTSPHFGHSDHISLFHYPAYRQRWKQMNHVTKQVKLWTSDKGDNNGQEEGEETSSATVHPGSLKRRGGSTTAKSTGELPPSSRTQPTPNTDCSHFYPQARGSLLSVTCTVKKWSEEAQEALKDCFNTTLWDVFSDAHGEDIDSLTHCLTDYINFCVENTVPTRTVRSFSNSKPWITPGH
ncbi:hypothetical protein L3Q82_007441 [Scortum barcoo]|uniref:Uncharacterized protein n=1 Tax=Scortum barcoo TaxID=214431 RepID=A0ACB8WNQ1_9TELE|nr:hypothetical protein L3Q82_007441 [Scortum barcoo]